MQKQGGSGIEVDLARKPTRGATRTLAAFRGALLGLAAEFSVPADLLADHYSSTVILVWQRCCLDGTCPHDEALGYLEALLGKL